MMTCYSPSNIVPYASGGNYKNLVWYEDRLNDHRFKFDYSRNSLIVSLFVRSSKLGNLEDDDCVHVETNEAGTLLVVRTGNKDRQTHAHNIKLPVAIVPNRKFYVEYEFAAPFSTAVIEIRVECDLFQSIVNSRR